MTSALLDKRSTVLKKHRDEVVRVIVMLQVLCIEIASKLIMQTCRVYTTRTVLSVLESLLLHMGYSSCYIIIKQLKNRCTYILKVVPDFIFSSMSQGPACYIFTITYTAWSILTWLSLSCWENVFNANAMYGKKVGIEIFRPFHTILHVVDDSYTSICIRGNGV